ncbi:MAG: hypothetical protein AAB463_00290 [Patescibacteria group bacterium]
MVGILSGSVVLATVCYFALGFWFLRRDECWGREELFALVGISKLKYASTWHRVAMAWLLWLTLLIWPIGYCIYESGVLDDRRRFTEED